ncbi:tryptophan synthase subunit alpha [Rhodohalobacter mucosus]|uniref:Tryptophan synthase alpha chain n=1 Tax=Rhodohalobacter mucosus TaxID=2079485 RepID=A0A316TW95_9BACT|nr:tryptophan synthase subunit alpha [Rhodohalobacter mucosus]PWN07649.1 tryptophan synthase subunit alpha [Rhodohalobacter mucosus]
MTTKSSRIQNVFDNRTGEEKIMSLFITAGYPDLESTVDLILGFEKNGADLIELGMPFSDPLADGPTIQYASNVAIKNGITMKRIFDMVRAVRKESDIPIILMGYINPVIRFGVQDFCREAAEAGVDGLIIPDAPLEESSIISKEAKDNGLDIIYLVAPNSTDERMKRVDAQSSGFVYCVSVTGVTGARSGEEVAKSVEKFIERVKENVKINPKLVGFGIKSHDDAKMIARETDGFIVGSALIDAIRKDYPDQEWMANVFAFVKELKYGNIEG